MPARLPWGVGAVRVSSWGAPADGGLRPSTHRLSGSGSVVGRGETVPRDRFCNKFATLLRSGGRWFQAGAASVIETFLVRQEARSCDHRRVTWFRAIVLALPVAALNEVASWRDIEPDALAAGVYAACALSLLALGFVAVWRGMIAFVPWFLVVGGVEAMWIYEPDRYDASSPLGYVVIAIPMYLVVIGVGVLAHLFAEQWRDQRTTATTPD